MSKVHQMSPGALAFHCPGCKGGHEVYVAPARSHNGSQWAWNGSMDAPTFTPSINCFADQPELRCHSFVRDGKIQFLADSFHELRGQTVEIPEWE